MPDSPADIQEIPVGIYRGVVEGIESGHCTARIEVRRGPGECRIVDYEAVSDAHGLQHIEHGLLSENALHLAFGEASGVTVFTKSEHGYPAALARELELTRTNVSNHLSCLRGCGIVVAEPEGRQTRYEIADPHIAAALTALVDVTLAVDECAPCMDPRCAVREGIEAWSAGRWHRTGISWADGRDRWPSSAGAARRSTRCHPARLRG